MGAFGLNASILDAANLAWKIGLCSKGAAKIDALMPTYDSERRNHAAKIIEISGRYLRFVCNSVLPVAQLLKAGRDPGFDSNGLPIEGRASDNSNGIESHKLDTENADESPNERNGTLNGNGTNGTYTNGSARQSNGPVKGTGKISSHDDYTEADLQKDREWLGGFFSEYGQFLLGTDAPYGKSCIVLQIGDNPGAAKRLASSVGNGVRAPNPRVCFNNDRTGYLYDKMKGASRFHLIVFGSDLLGPARRHLTELSRALTDPQSFYNRFGAQDRFNIVLVVKGVPFELEDKFGSGPLDTLRAAAEVVCDDRPPEEDAHSTYGVDHSTGAIIAVRPDLWVGMSAIPSDLECLDGYFSSFLVPVSSN
jgi:phenol 2-monooxygenase